VPLAVVAVESPDERAVDLDLVDRRRTLGPWRG
jgi:hypothetical protein